MSIHENDTKTKILRACLDLLAEGAGTGIRMSDIAKRAKVSRQALYLHFQSRADLLIAATKLDDEKHGIQELLKSSRNATTGKERLSAYIRSWCSYIPIIYPMVRTLLHLSESDEEVAEAWRARMEDMREGCEAAIAALEIDGDLNPAYDVKTATDLLWVLISVRNWELLTRERGWSQEKFVTECEATALTLFYAP